MIIDKPIGFLPLTLLWQTLKKGTGIHGGTGIDVTVLFNFFQEPPN
jgi:hypothetical protein